MRRSTLNIALLSAAAGCTSARTVATSPPAAGEAPAPAAGAPQPARCEVPAGQRTGDIGCWLTAVQPLGALPDVPVFWHVYRYRTRAAAEAARAPRSTVVEVFGRVLLYAIADSAWRPAGGERVAVIGPLPHEPGREYTARYMEATFTPGMRTATHVHSGAEAWYLFEGGQCLETPEGITVMHAGESSMVRAGPPMVLSSMGTETRRSILLVLHDSMQPWNTRVNTWTPKGLCPP